MLFFGLLFVYLGLSDAVVVEGSSEDYSEIVAQAIYNIKHFLKNHQQGNFEDYNFDMEWLSFDGTDIVFGDLSSLELLQEPIVTKTVNQVATVYEYQLTLRLSRAFAKMQYKLELFEEHISSKGNMTVTPRENSFEVRGAVTVPQIESCQNNITSIVPEYSDLSLDVQPHDVAHFFAKPVISLLLKSNQKNMFDFKEMINSFLSNSTIQQNIGNVVCVEF